MGGLHRHALMSMIAYAFLHNRRLVQASGEKNHLRAAAPAEPAGDQTSYLGSALHAFTASMSPLQSMAHP